MFPGFVVPSQSLMRWRHAAVIVTADGRISMVAIDMEATTVKAHAGIDDLRIYREFTDDPMDKLAEALKDLKLDRGKVGIELEFLPAKDFQHLAKKSSRRSMGRRGCDFQQGAADQNARRAGAAALAQQAHR